MEPVQETKMSRHIKKQEPSTRFKKNPFSLCKTDELELDHCLTKLNSCTNNSVSIFCHWV